jgi:hypothetical protein
MEGHLNSTTAAGHATPAAGIPVNGKPRHKGRRLIDLTGKRFGRLDVSNHADRPRSYWSCICDCGARVVVRGDSLRGGVTQSCGCQTKEWAAFHRIDLTGKRFGRWVVRAYAGDGMWSCICDCGARAIVHGPHLRRGNTKSCGCRRCTHRMTKSREYVSWRSMKQRCSNPRSSNYENYGGRGIAVCEDWSGRYSFVPFFADNGSRPPVCTLDRIDPNGNYEPRNVRWADSKTQTQNRRPRRARATVKRRRQAERLLPPLDDPPF